MVTFILYYFYSSIIILFQIIAYHFPKGSFLWGIFFPCHKINLQTRKFILHQFEDLHKLWDTPGLKSKRWFLFYHNFLLKTTGGISEYLKQTNFL